MGEGRKESRGRSLLESATGSVLPNKAAKSHFTHDPTLHRSPTESESLKISNTPGMKSKST